MPQLRGVAHVHSTYSFDGRLTLDRVGEFFKERGIHFVLMSEHVESLDPEKILSFIKDCSTYSSDRFLLIPGIEVDALNALFYNVGPVRAWTDYEDLARQLADGGALVAVSHPIKVKKDIPQTTAMLMKGVEVWNSRHDGKRAPNAKVVGFWRSMRQRVGRQLLPLCGIDFHDKHDFVPLIFEVDCERLDRHDVMTAMIAGRYRIGLGAKMLPLDFATGRLSLGYRLYSILYRLAYDVVYAMYLVALRMGVSVPKGLKSRLSRVF